MALFKAYQAQPLRRPMVHQVLWAQLAGVGALTLLAASLAPITGLSVFLGGIIATLAQSYFNIRALREYGHPDVRRVVAATQKAMWGKWGIVIGFSLAVILSVEQISAGALFTGVFIIHTLGALLLPVFVKKAAD